MYSGLMMHELVKAVQRESGWTDAPQNGWTTRSYRTGNGGLTAGAQYVIGSAFVRAGRYLKGETAPRPEPLGR